VEVRCQHCGQPHRVPRDIFDNRNERIALSCPSCGQTFHVLNPKLTTLRVETTHRKVSSVAERMNFEGRELRLPENQEVALKVLEGEEKGTVYPVKKPRVTIGRSNADINLDDRATSRVHCAVEVSAQGVTLRDLDSTNGTLVNDVPIDIAELTPGSTFRVGRHLFQLVITPKEA
jgi:pSer/pThr/pTyr-binding forkhead associated (FHA) protein